MKYFKMGFISIFSMLTLLLSSCSKDTATCVITTEGMSVNMVANLPAQIVLQEAITEQNKIFLNREFNLRDAEKEFDNFISRTADRIENTEIAGNKLIILDDSWVELNMIWGSDDKILVKRLTLEPSSK